MRPKWLEQMRFPYRGTYQTVSSAVGCPRGISANEKCHTGTFSKNLLRLYNMFLPIGCQFPDCKALLILSLSNSCKQHYLQQVQDLDLDLDIVSEICYLQRHSFCSFSSFQKFVYVLQ